MWLEEHQNYTISCQELAGYYKGCTSRPVLNDIEGRTSTSFEQMMQQLQRWSNDCHEELKCDLIVYLAVQALPTQ